MPNLRRLPPAPSIPTGTVATFDTTVAGGYAWEPLPPPVHNVTRTGPLIFDVTDPTYGAVGDGVTDDTAAVQAAVNAAGLVGGGTIWWPAGTLTLLKQCINLPSHGNYQFSCGGGRSSLYARNDSLPVTGVIFNVLTGQPSSISDPNIALTQFAFSALAATALSANGDVTITFFNFFAYYTGGGGASHALILLTPGVYAASFVHCAFGGTLAVTYFSPGAFVGGPQTQMLYMNDLLGGPSWFMWSHNGGPLQAVITNCIWTLPGDLGGGNPMPHGEWLEQDTFYTASIHHNYLVRSGGATTVRNVIHYAGISQTCNGTIDHNAVVGCSGGVVYIKDDNPRAIGAFMSGITIDYNEFTDWNHDNIVGGTGAAIFIDTSAAGAPQEIIRIGPNNLIGGAQSKFGIVLVDPPDRSSVSIDPNQNMRFIQTAPYRIADSTGTLRNYGQGTRSVADGVTTNLSPTVTSATAGWLDTEIGQPITGAGIPAGAYIGILNAASPSNSIGLSSSPAQNTPLNATATATGVTLTWGGVSTRLHAVFPAVTIPATATAIINPFGLDATVTITAGAGSTTVVAIDGATVATIVASAFAVFPLPRGATIKLTYTSAPTWTWRGA